MGIFDAIFGSKKKTETNQTSTTTPNVDPNFQGPMADIGSRAGALLAQDPSTLVAPLNDTQNLAINGVTDLYNDPAFRGRISGAIGDVNSGETAGYRQMLAQGLDPALAQAIYGQGRGAIQGDLIQTGYQPQNVTAGSVNAPALNTNYTGAVGRVGTSDTGVADIQSRMSPYIQTVMDPALQAFDLNAAQQAAQSRARRAGSRAFGSGGERAALMENYLSGLQRNQVSSGLLQQGYTAASALSEADKARALQAGTANLGASQAEQGLNAQTGVAGAQMGLQSQLANQSAALQAAQGNQQAGLAANAQNQQGQGVNLQAILQMLQGQQQGATNLGQMRQSALTTAGGQGLQAGALTGQLAGQDVSSVMAMLQGLMGAGNTQYDVTQRGLQAPYTQLGNISNIVYGAPMGQTATGSGTSTSTSTPSLFDIASGIAKPMASAGMFKHGGIVRKYASGGIADDGQGWMRSLPPAVLAQIQDRIRRETGGAGTPEEVARRAQEYLPGLIREQTGGALTDNEAHEYYYNPKSPAQYLGRSGYATGGSVDDEDSGWGQLSLLPPEVRDMVMNGGSMSGRDEPPIPALQSTISKSGSEWYPLKGTAQMSAEMDDVQGVPALTQGVSDDRYDAGLPLMQRTTSVAARPEPRSLNENEPALGGYDPIASIRPKELSPEGTIKAASTADLMGNTLKAMTQAPRRSFGDKLRDFLDADSTVEGFGMFSPAWAAIGERRDTAAREREKLRYGVALEDRKFGQAQSLERMKMKNALDVAHIAHPDAGGGFTGEAMPAQVGNIVLAYNRKLSNGEQPTPDEEATYAYAYRTATRPQIVTQADGSQITIPGMDMTGFAQPKYGGAALGPGGNAAQGGGQGDANAALPGSRAVSEKSLTGPELMLNGLIDEARPLMPQIRTLAKDPKQLDIIAMNWGLPWTNGPQYANTFDILASNRLRFESQGQISPAEISEQKKKLLPSTFDSAPVRKQKLQSLLNFWDSVISNQDPKRSNSGGAALRPKHVYNREKGDFEDAA